MAPIFKRGCEASINGPICENINAEVNSALLSLTNNTTAGFFDFKIGRKARQGLKLRSESEVYGPLAIHIENGDSEKPGSDKNFAGRVRRGGGY